MVKLVHDHNIKVVCRKLIELCCGHALNRRKHMLKPLWLGTSHPQFTKRRFPQGMPKRRHGLRENLFAMGHKQQPRAREPCRKPAVVHRGHDRLASSGRRGQQISMVSLQPRECNFF